MTKNINSMAPVNRMPTLSIPNGKKARVEATPKELGFIYCQSDINDLGNVRISTGKFPNGFINVGGTGGGGDGHFNKLLVDTSTTTDTLIVNDLTTTKNLTVSDTIETQTLIVNGDSNLDALAFNDGIGESLALGNLNVLNDIGAKNIEVTETLDADTVQAEGIQSNLLTVTSLSTLSKTYASGLMVGEMIKFPDPSLARGRPLYGLSVDTTGPNVLNNPGWVFDVNAGIPYDPDETFMRGSPISGIFQLRSTGLMLSTNFIRFTMPRVLTGGRAYRAPYGVIFTPAIENAADPDLIPFWWTQVNAFERETPETETNFTLHLKGITTDSDTTFKWQYIIIGNEDLETD